MSPDSPYRSTADGPRDEQERRSSQGPDIHSCAGQSFMKKFMWLLHSSLQSDQFYKLWMAAETAWRRPESIVRWRRSAGTTEQRLSRPHDDLVGRPVALEEIWCAAAAVDEVREAIVSPERGLRGEFEGAVDFERSALALTRELVVIESKDSFEAGVTHLPLYRRNPLTTRAESHAHWRDIHGPMVVRGGYITGYTQCYVEDAEADFDGFAIVHWDTAQACEEFGRSDELLKRQLVDAPSFSDLSRLDVFSLHGPTHEVDLG